MHNKTEWEAGVQMGDINMKRNKKKKTHQVAPGDTKPVGRWASVSNMAPREGQKRAQLYDFYGGGGGGFYDRICPLSA
jgi:hypothetical protein